MPRSNIALTLVATMWCTAAGGALAQQRLPQQSSVADVAVNVTAPEGVVSDEQALQALEEAAQKLRARIAARRNGEVADQYPGNNLQERAPHETGIIPQVNPQVFPVPMDRLTEAAPQPDGDEGDEYTFTMFPKSLFWQPPLANPWQPRMYAKLSSLKDQHTSRTIDTAIGNTFGLYRITPADNPNVGLQLDFFAVVLSRWSGSSHHVGSDYRFGIPLTFAWGNWQGKIAYEHSSSHLGDDYILTKGKFQNHNVSDEIAVGLAYRFLDSIRVYGVWGVPIRAYNLAGTEAQHIDCGIEWSRRASTSVYGQPFAAFDMEMSQEQNWVANTTTQIGWQWLASDTGHSLRLALEYFHGKSTYGQFFLEREHWYSVGVYLDY